jgi:transposase-like protein
LEAYVKIINIKGGYSAIEVFETIETPEDDIFVVYPPGHRFTAMFISLKEQKQFSTTIKYVSVDATHLTGKFKCVLMCASTLDADGKLIILAQAILPKETSQGWNFFFYHFKLAGLGDNITFIMSDRDKGLINAANMVFPHLPHAKCVRHMAENYKKRFCSDFSNILLQMAMSYSAYDHAYYEAELEEKAGEVSTAWIDNAEPTMWCRSLFPVPRFGVVTSNTIEIVFAKL